MEDSPLLESLRDEPSFVEFRNEVARRRAVMKRRVQAMREQLGLMPRVSADEVKTCCRPGSSFCRLENRSNA